LCFRIVLLAIEALRFRDCNNEIDFSAAVQMPAVPTFSLRLIEI